MIIAWFSGGVTSAIACKLALETMEDVHIVYIETGSHHPQHQDFLKACSLWYQHPIEVIRSSKYNNVSEVIKKVRFLNGPSGAACTRILKKEVRLDYEKGKDIAGQVWGFDFSKSDINRANRLKSSNPNMKCFFPLIDNQITKQDAITRLQNAGIDIPIMYKLGYTNNNCIGCVKGGAAYWNKIRVDFPEVFSDVAKLEREIGHSCLRKYFLDELPIDAGRGKPPLVLDCGSVGEGCETDNMRAYIQLQNEE